MRRVLITLVVLVAVLGIADIGARFAAERAIAREIRAAVPARDVDVSIEGFPVLWYMLRGGLPAVEFTITDMEVDDPPVVLGSVRVRTTDVDVSVPDLFRGTARVRIGGGTVEVVADEPAVDELVRRRQPDWELTLLAGEVAVAGTPLGVDVEGTAIARVEGGELILQLDLSRLGGQLPEGVPPFDLQIDLPELPYGVVLDDVRVEPGRLVLTGRVPEGAELVAPG